MVNLDGLYYVHYCDYESAKFKLCHFKVDSGTAAEVQLPVPDIQTAANRIQVCNILCRITVIWFNKNLKIYCDISGPYVCPVSYIIVKLQKLDARGKNEDCRRGYLKWWGRKYCNNAGKMKSKMILQ